jgi:putative FmdB family regulatory protein
MPIYEYRCSACQHKLESLQKLSDPPLKTCPVCGEETLTKLVSAAGFQLKGSGWYATDFKHSGSKPAAKEKTEGKTEGADKAAEAKPASSDGAPAAKTDSASAPASTTTPAPAAAPARSPAD